MRGVRALEMAAVTLTESSATEHPVVCLPTGHTRGMAPQSRLHCRRPLSTDIGPSPLQTVTQKDG